MSKPIQSTTISRTKNKNTNNQFFYKMKENNVIYSDAFWAGYRAFVFGGRDIMFAQGGNDVFISGGIEPFEHLPERMKNQWRAGVDYAKKEREECMALSVGISKRDTDGFTEKQRVLIALFDENPDAKSMAYTDIAKIVGVSSFWVSANVHKLGLAREVKTFPTAAKQKDLRALCATPRGRKMSFHSIAVILGVSTTWVVSHIHKLGLPHDKIKDWNKWEKTEEQLDKICKEAKEKFSVKGIKALAKRLNVSTSYVYAKVRKAGR